MAGIHWTILLLSSIFTIVVVTSEKTFVPSSSKAVWGVPRGGEDGSVAFATPSYASQCEDVKSSIIADASKQVCNKYSKDVMEQDHLFTLISYYFITSQISFSLFSFNIFILCMFYTHITSIMVI